MSRSSVILVLRDGPRGRRRVTVNGARFGIGRAPGNDLVLDGPGVADRHAVITNIFGAFFLADCGARCAMTLNGQRLAGKKQLRDGDVIVMGGAREIRVKLVPRPLAGLYTAAGNSALLVALASAAAVLVLVVLVAALLPSSKAGEQESAGEEVAPGGAGPTAGPTAASGATSPAQTPPDDEGGASREDKGERDAGQTERKKIEVAAVKVLRRISRDDKPYAFDDEALGDISEKVEEYGASQHMGDALRQMQGGMQQVVARARAEGIEPSLVAFAALALTDGGRSGRDPASAARSMLPELVSLSKTLGGGGADSSLIVLAAYTEGAGTKRSHPLLSRIRKSVRSPLTERNVWFLHERGIIDERAYSFVVSFLACGIIAQDPRRFGVEADALSL